MLSEDRLEMVKPVFAFNPPKKVRQYMKVRYSYLFIKIYIKSAKKQQDKKYYYSVTTK